MSKNVLITGTSRGIGYELAKQFTASGHRVIAVSRNRKPIAHLNLEACLNLACDLTNPEQLNKLITAISKELETIDIVINNSGYLVHKPFEQLTLNDWEQSYKVNVFGVAGLLKGLIPMINPKGHVVNISSMGGVMGSAKFPGLAAYSSSKGALITLTEVLAEEYKETGPSFNVLALGAVQTEMLEAAFPGYQAPITAAQMAKYIMEFALNGHNMYNGKVLPVSNSTP